jgi:Na+-translocating ferredoxin:NAD+ oxidoreductase subunit E
MIVAAGEFRRALTSENPLLVLALGLCPALAVTSSVIDSAVMGIIVTVVLICSNVFVSLFKGLLTERIQFLGSVVIAATFTALFDLVLSAYLPQISERLGIYVPLIAVNCVVLNRIKTIAARSGIKRSFADGFSVGAGYFLALLAIGALREVIGNNTVLGFPAIPGYSPVLAITLAPGAFLILGFSLGLVNYLRTRKGRL